jgi:hypothetical protein
VQCYFCPEKFSCDHKCAAQGGVFCITMDATAEGDDAISEDDLGILMHALSCVAPSDNLRLRVRNNGVELTALVDSGSTHTFIHDDVARRIGLTSPTSRTWWSRSRMARSSTVQASAPPLPSPYVNTKNLYREETHM